MTLQLAKPIGAVTHARVELIEFSTGNVYVTWLDKDGVSVNSAPGFVQMDLSELPTEAELLAAFVADLNSGIA
jgi:hypothetical protein